MKTYVHAWALFAAVAVAAAGTSCGPVETTNGYQGEFSITLFANDVTHGWVFDEQHDIFWVGESTEFDEVRCVLDEVQRRGRLTVRAHDTRWKQGFELTLRIDEFDGDGVYELATDASSPTFDMTLITEDGTFDLETRNSGTCTVTIARGELFGDFSCPALQEYGKYGSDLIDFTVTGRWECAELTTEG